MTLEFQLTPSEIVAELNQYIIGQQEAKKAVAIALRNRWRRQQLPEEMAEEILPKNIILIGPTGVGKTEIARRLARLANAPFIKVEASKFTEVGYVGRDVESIVRDLVENGVKMVREEEAEKVRENARQEVEKKLYQQLREPADFQVFRTALWQGGLDQKEVEVEVEERVFPRMEIFTPQGIQDMDMNIQDMMGNIFGGRKRRKKISVKEARDLLLQREEDNQIDHNKVVQEAIRRTEQMGIVFIDEIDKVAGRETKGGPDVSREGVQRDLLPLVEGTTVRTRYGSVRTEHILFIAAGAFHISKPSDLIPELQGRFPLRVELNPLTKEDFVLILTQPKNALIKQYKALLETEGVHLTFQEDAIERIADYAEKVNEITENIGARRLHTLMEKLLEDISFNAPQMRNMEITIDAHYVEERLHRVVEDRDYSRYML